MLEINNLTKIYEGDVKALDDVSFKVEKGEFLAVIGLSGSGKSTLLRCINRLIEPTAGQIIWDGTDVTAASQDELLRIRRKFGMVFQHFNLVTRSKVLTNVLAGRLGYVNPVMSLINRFPKSDKEMAFKQMERVGISDQAYKRADELSGGQQQRVGIARAMMQEPEMILADEPVASLDPVLAHSILNYLEKLNQEDQMTIVCSLHYLDLVQRYSTRVLGLRDGEIVYRGTREQIRSMTDEEFKEIYGEDAQRVTEGLEGSLEDVA
jgi:phosphonate transport system ATP-binding protein